MNLNVADGFCVEVASVEFGSTTIAAAAVLASSLFFCGCLWFSGQSGGEKQQLPTNSQSSTGSQLSTMQSPDASSMFPHWAMLWGMLPRRIPQPCAGYGPPRPFQAGAALAPQMCPQPCAGHGSPRQFQPQTAMAPGMCPLPCASYGSPRPLESQVSMA